MAKCDKLLREAFDGINFEYKLDTVMSDMPKESSFSANTINAYLEKKGVSPKEIKASGILDMYKGDFKLSAEDWQEDYLRLQRNSKLVEQDVTNVGIRKGYDDVTLGTKGYENPFYKESLLTGKKPPNAPTNIGHYSEFDNSRNSVIGWRRTHIDNINGKPTTVLNEFQSDWEQTERAGRGTFESNPTRLRSETDIYNEIVDIRNIAQAEWLEGIGKTLDDFYAMDEGYDAFFVYLAREKPEVAARINSLYNELDGPITSTANIVADFPMAPKKFHQYQIVASLDEAIKNGTNRVAIPIERENELVGTEGVTKFYDSLNKSILPDIRKKLEKQGLRITVGKETYGNKSQISKLKALQAEHARSFNPETGEILISPEAWEDLLTEIQGLQKLQGNTLHIIDIVEKPNKAVRWDMYGMLGAVGLGSLADKLKEGESQ